MFLFIQKHYSGKTSIVTKLFTTLALNSLLILLFFSLKFSLKDHHFVISPSKKNPVPNTHLSKVQTPIFT